MKAILRSVLLVLGAVVIVTAAFVTLSVLTDRTVFTVLVPGCIVGMILIGVSIRLGSTAQR